MRNKAPKKLNSITSEQRLDKMLAETEAELEKLQPRIEKLEKQVEKLQELRLTKQRLITLKLSLKAILENFSDNPGAVPDVLGAMDTASFSSNLAYAAPASDFVEPSGVFFPDQAMTEVGRVFRRHKSLNYDLFKAIVYNGGKATTEEIKAYLVENEVKQPTSGESFEDAPLSDISSRTNYLVRKGIVQADGRGLFVSRLGWRRDG